MSMPETAVDEDTGSVLGQRDVGCSWKRADILAETEAAFEQFLTQDDFLALCLLNECGTYLLRCCVVILSDIVLILLHYAANLSYLSRICRLSLNDSEPSPSFMICAYSCLVVLARSRYALLYRKSSKRFLS